MTHSKQKLILLLFECNELDEKISATFHLHLVLPLLLYQHLSFVSRCSNYVTVNHHCHYKIRILFFISFGFKEIFNAQNIIHPWYFEFFVVNWKKFARSLIARHDISFSFRFCSWTVFFLRLFSINLNHLSASTCASQSWW